MSVQLEAGKINNPTGPNLLLFVAESMDQLVHSDRPLPAQDVLFFIQKQTLVHKLRGDISRVLVDATEDNWPWRELDRLFRRGGSPQSIGSLEGPGERYVLTGYQGNERDIVADAELKPPSLRSSYALLYQMGVFPEDMTFAQVVNQSKPSFNNDDFEVRRLGGLKLTLWKKEKHQSEEEWPVGKYSSSLYITWTNEELLGSGAFIAVSNESLADEERLTELHGQPKIVKEPSQIEVSLSFRDDHDGVWKRAGSLSFPEVKKQVIVASPARKPRFRLPGFLGG